MKIILTDSQYGLLKESYSNEGINGIIKYWKKKLDKGNEIRFAKDELEYWGITKFRDEMEAQIAFQELVGGDVFAEKVIKTLLDKKFSTKDFGHLNIGGYDFEWIITELEYRDYDFYLYGRTLPGGSVTLLDQRHMSLEDALEDEEIGMEIQNEVNGVVDDCMNDIILPVTGFYVTVPVMDIY